VDRCPDGLDCPFCGDAPFYTSDCESEFSDTLQVMRVEVVEKLAGGYEKSPARLFANWLKGQPNYVMQSLRSALEDGERNMTSKYAT